MSAKRNPVSPWAPVTYDEAITSAIKALQAGVASSDQQRIGLRWIIETASGTYDMSYRPGTDGDRDTAFAEGRRFVGNQIIKQTKLRQATPK